jgi:hypothetical protein
MNHNCFSASALRAEMCGDTAFLKNARFMSLNRVRGKEGTKERQENCCCEKPVNRWPKRNDDLTPIHVHLP